MFAVTQLSQNLLTHFSQRGAVETLVLFLAVWRAWNPTAWATNWADPQPDSRPGDDGRSESLGPVMASANPEAFGENGMGFAAGYVLWQLLQSGFMVFAFRKSGDATQRNFARLLT